MTVEQGLQQLGYAAQLATIDMAQFRDAIEKARPAFEEAERHARLMSAQWVAERQQLTNSMWCGWWWQ